AVLEHEVRRAPGEPVGDGRAADARAEERDQPRAGPDADRRALRAVARARVDRAQRHPALTGGDDPLVQARVEPRRPGHRDRDRRPPGCLLAGGSGGRALGRVDRCTGPTTSPSSTAPAAATARKGARRTGRKLVTVLMRTRL